MTMEHTLAAVRRVVCTYAVPVACGKPDVGTVNPAKCAQCRAVEQALASVAARRAPYVCTKCGAEYDRPGGSCVNTVRRPDGALVDCGWPIVETPDARRAALRLSRVSWSKERGFFHDPNGPWVEWRHVDAALSAPSPSCVCARPLAKYESGTYRCRVCALEVKAAITAALCADCGHPHQDMSGPCPYGQGTGPHEEPCYCTAFASAPSPSEAEREIARPTLLERAIADRDARPWRYYRFERDDLKKWLEKVADERDALAARVKELQTALEKPYALELAAYLGFIHGKDIDSTVERARAYLVERALRAEARVKALEASRADVEASVREELRQEVIPCRYQRILDELAAAAEIPTQDYGLVRDALLADIKTARRAYAPAPTASCLHTRCIQEQGKPETLTCQLCGENIGRQAGEIPAPPAPPSC